MHPKMLSYSDVCFSQWDEWDPVGSEIISLFSQEINTQIIKIKGFFFFLEYATISLLSSLRTLSTSDLHWNLQSVLTGKQPLMSEVEKKTKTVGLFGRHVLKLNHLK